MAYSKEFLEQMAGTQDVFVWEAPSWERYPRSSKWYLWMGLVAFGFVVYAILTTNYLFAFIILLCAIVLVLGGNEPPHAELVQIGHNGVVVGGRMIPFMALSDFAIIYQPPETKVLYLQPKSAFQPRIRILLQDEDPVALRSHLRQYIDEDLDLRDEHLSDIVGRLLRL